MWYMPYVRVRRAVLIYALIAVAVTFVAVAFHWAPGVVKLDRADAAQLATVRIDLSMLLSGAAALVGGFATVLGLNLAAENDGHLELAWTKPVSREGYALGVFAVDLAAMAVCIVLTTICAVIVVDIHLGHQAVGLPSPSALVSGLAICGFPVLIYAWITALSASLKRNRGTVAGLFWPLMMAFALLGAVGIPSVHIVASALNLFNPIGIFSSSPANPDPLATYLWGWGVAALLLGAALVQWRRLEI